MSVAVIINHPEHPDVAKFLAHHDNFNKREDVKAHLLEMESLYAKHKKGEITRIEYNSLKNDWAKQMDKIKKEYCDDPSTVHPNKYEDEEVVSFSF